MLKRRSVSAVIAVAIATAPAHPEVMGIVVLGMYVRNISVVNRKLALTPVQLNLTNISIQHYYFKQYLFK